MFLYEAYNRPHLKSKFSSRIKIGASHLCLRLGHVGLGFFKFKPTFLFDAKKKEGDGQGPSINLMLKNQCWVWMSSYKFNKLSRVPAPVP